MKRLPRVVRAAREEASSIRPLRIRAGRLGAGRAGATWLAFACVAICALAPAQAAESSKGLESPNGHSAPSAQAGGNKSASSGGAGSSSPGSAGADHVGPGSAPKEPAPAVSGNRVGPGPLVTVVFANASASDAVGLLSRVSGMRVALSPGTSAETLPLLSVVAQREPFYILLQQISMAEGLGIVPCPGGFMLFSVRGGYGQLRTGPGGPGTGITGTGSPGTGSVAFAGPAAGPTAAAGPAAAAGPTVAAGPPVWAGPAAGIASPELSSPMPPIFPGAAGRPDSGAVRRTMPTVAPVSAASDPAGSADEQPRTEDLLQYVLSFARSQGPGMPPPDQVFPSLRTSAGSLKYVAVATEALSHLPGAAGASITSPSTSGAVTRLRILLGRAEELHSRACLREQLQTEIIVLTDRIPRADPSMQPLLRTVLEHRQQQLAALNRQ